MAYQIPSQPDLRRYKFALDLIETLSSQVPPREEFLREAAAWTRSDNGCVADLLGTDPSQDETLGKQLCAVTVAVALVSNWEVTAKQYRDALGNLIAGLDAIRNLSDAFAARENPQGDPLSEGVWRLVAAGIEAEFAAVAPRMPTKQMPRTLDDGAETISSGNLGDLREASRRAASVWTEQWNDLLLDVARVAGRPRSLATHQMKLKVEVSGTEAEESEAVSSVVEAAGRLLRRAGELDGRFALLPTPAMTAAFGALCLWDEYLQKNNLPDFRQGNVLQELAWRILDIAGVGADKLLPRTKSVLHREGMEKTLKVIAKAYVRLKINPFLSSGKKGFWERHKAKGVADKSSIKPFAHYFSRVSKKND